jgi:hypothetical protein
MSDKLQFVVAQRQAKAYRTSILLIVGPVGTRIETSKIKLFCSLQ